MTRDEQRSGRHREVRARTINLDRLPIRERRFEQVLYPQHELDENQAARPKTRGDCEESVRPCPWVACRHNLYLDVPRTTGSIKLNFPDLEPADLEHSCALDVAARGGITLEDVARLMNITRERTRQIEDRAIARVRNKASTLRVFAEEGALQPPVHNTTAQSMFASAQEETMTEDVKDRIVRELRPHRRASARTLATNLDLALNVVQVALFDLNALGILKSRGEKPPIYYLAEVDVPTEPLKVNGAAGNEKEDTPIPICPTCQRARRRSWSASRGSTRFRPTCRGEVDLTSAVASRAWTPRR